MSATQGLDLIQKLACIASAAPNPLTAPVAETLKLTRKTPVRPPLESKEGSADSNKEEEEEEEAKEAPKEFVAAQTGSRANLASSLERDLI